MREVIPFLNGLHDEAEEAEVEGVVVVADGELLIGLISIRVSGVWFIYFVLVS